MKRRISLIIAFALSFLMMFSPIARAEQVKIQITVTTPESAEVEVVKVPPTETNQVFSPLSQAKTSNQVWGEGKPGGITPKSCSFTCSDGAPGFLSQGRCIPC